MEEFKIVQLSIEENSRIFGGTCSTNEKCCATQGWSGEGIGMDNDSQSYNDYYDDSGNNWSDGKPCK